MTPSTCSCLRTRDDVDVDVAGRPLTSGVVGCRLADLTTGTLPLPVAARAARRPGATPTPASSGRRGRRRRRRRSAPVAEPERAEADRAAPAGRVTGPESSGRISARPPRPRRS